MTLGSARAVLDLSSSAAGASPPYSWTQHRQQPLSPILRMRMLPRPVVDLGHAAVFLSGLPLPLCKVSGLNTQECNVPYCSSMHHAFLVAESSGEL